MPSIINDNLKKLCCSILLQSCLLYLVSSFIYNIIYHVVLYCIIYLYIILLYSITIMLSLILVVYHHSITLYFYIAAIVIITHTIFYNFKVVFNPCNPQLQYYIKLRLSYCCVLLSLPTLYSSTISSTFSIFNYYFALLFCITITIVCNWI